MLLLLGLKGLSPMGLKGLSPMLLLPGLKGLSPMPPMLLRGQSLPQSWTVLGRFLLMLKDFLSQRKLFWYPLHVLRGSVPSAWRRTPYHVAKSMRLSWWVATRLPSLWPQVSVH